MGAREALAGAARKIAGKIGNHRAPESKEDLVLGAETIPNGYQFDTTKKQGATIAPEKKPPVMVG